MSRRRTGAGELARALEAAARPVYLLDAQARVVYLNPACAAWLGVEAEQVLGADCRYGLADSADAQAGIAAGLCPPPEVLQGRRLKGVVASVRPDGTLSQRSAEFIPLPVAEDGEAAVLAMVDASDLLITEETAAPDDPQSLHAALQQARTELRGRYRPESLVGRSPAMRRVRRQVKLAATERGTVSIFGPPGSGRQHVARAIHYAQPEPLGPFVPLDCAALSAEMVLSSVLALDALLERDVKTAPTLLLRSVESLAVDAQAQLAGRISSGRATGRWMATSEAALEELALAGKFQPDLASLLSTTLIRVPSFDERRPDLPLVAQAFLEELNGRGGKQLSGFTPEALDVLSAHPPRGGWDELAEWIREAHERARELHIDRAALPDRVRYLADASAYRRPREESIDLEKFIGEIELELINRALATAKGNKTKAAELLNMNRAKFYRRLEQLGLAAESMFQEVDDEP